MKNIQIIDGALNCAYSIFQTDDETFAEIFPAPMQDVEFADDLDARLGASRLREVFNQLWKQPIDKKQAHGIHGTLFFGLPAKKAYYPSKREVDLEDKAVLRKILK